LGDFEDVKQIAYLAVLEAIDRFDPKISTNIEGFICSVIKNKIMLSLKNSGIIRVPVGWRSKIKETRTKFRRAYNVIMSNELISYIVHYDKSNHEYDDIYKAIDALSKRYRIILGHLYGLYDLPQLDLTELAHKLGISKQRVYQLEQRALSLLRKIL